MYEDARIRLQDTLVRGQIWEHSSLLASRPALQSLRVPLDGDLATEFDTQTETVDVGD